MTGRCQLICGEDDFQVSHEARKAIDALVAPENRTFGLEVIDGRVDTVEECLGMIRKSIEAMTMDGLFGGGDKTIWLREPVFLSIDRIAKSEVVKRLLQELTDKIKAGLPEGQNLLVTTFKINRGSAFFKAFAASGSVKDFGSGLKAKACETRAKKLVDDWLPQLQLTMAEPVRMQFIARVGTDSRQLVSELEKLKSYCGERATATAEDVRVIVSGGRISEIWDFLDAFGRRQAAHVIAQLRLQLDQSENPIRLANSLEARVTDLLIIREALDRKWAVFEGYAGLRWMVLPPAIETWFTTQENDMRKWPPFRVTRLVSQANVWTLRELRVARHLLLEMREALVSTALPQAWLLEVSLIRALGRTAKKR